MPATQATQITQVGTVIVPVSDQDRALELWLGLGFEKRLDAPLAPGRRWIEVAPHGAATSIALVESDGAGRGGVEVSFTTRDAAADLEALRARGIDTGSGLVEMGPGVPAMFTFCDDDGNRFRVVERPD